MGPQVPEVSHDSSTDTFPYSSGSPKPFPPSPVHPVTDSPVRVSPLFIDTSSPSDDVSPVHRSTGHNSPTPASFTIPVLTFSQTLTSVSPIQTTSPSINPFYTPYFSSSSPRSGPIVFPWSPPDFPYFGVPLPKTSSTFSEAIYPPFYPISSMVAPTAKSIPFFSSEPQSMPNFGPYRRCGRGSRDTYPGRGRAPRGRRGKTTSTTSCQTSPTPSYFWPDHQPSLVSSRGPFAGEALNLATMPRAFDHFPVSLPSNPLHHDFFTVLRAASPVVIFHCPSPLTQKSFSFVYAIRSPLGQDNKPFLVAGINQ